MLEFALILPLLLLVIGGGYTLWTGLNAGMAVTSAARAGALTAANELMLQRVQPRPGPAPPTPRRS